MSEGASIEDVIRDFYKTLCKNYREENDRIVFNIEHMKEAPQHLKEYAKNLKIISDKFLNT
jgi:hypothetical protein